MQYIQLQQQSPNDIPNAANGSVNLFMSNNGLELKNDNGQETPQVGGGNPLDNIQMELSWNSGSTIGVNGERVRLLDIDINVNDILTGTTGDEVWLYIERYKRKRYKKNAQREPIVSSAQWKHGVYPDESNPDRPSELQLFSASNKDVYFGQENYFTVKFDAGNNEFKDVISKGLGRRSSDKATYVYLRFKLKIGSDVNGWSYTKPLAKIRLMWEHQYTDNLLQLNYKYV